MQVIKGWTEFLVKDFKSRKRFMDRAANVGEKCQSKVKEFESASYRKKRS